MAPSAQAPRHPKKRQHNTKPQPGHPQPGQLSASTRGFFHRGLHIADPVAELQIRRRGMPIDDLIDIADRLDGHRWETGTDLPMFVISETARATKTTRAAAMLASQGYGPQALVLARTLTESMFFIRWAVLKPEGVDDRLHLHFRHAATVEGETWNSSGIQRRDSRPTPALTQTERDQAVEWFGKRGTRLWTSHPSIKDLVRELIEVETINGTSDAMVGLLRAVFELMLTWADRMTHTTGISTMSDVQDSLADPDVGYVSSGPSLAELQQAMMLTQTTYSLILDALLPKIAPELVDELTASTSRAWRSHPDIERLLAVQPQDRCICDRPQGTWAQCHMSTEQHADHAFEVRMLKAVRRRHAPR